MKICAEHWQTMRDAIEERGMTGLVAKSGEAAFEDMKTQLDEAKPDGTLSEETIKKTFDPLMSMNWHWTNAALQAGGLAVMCVDEAGNDQCPVCLFAKHDPTFEAKEAIGSIGDQMQAWCREEGLIPKAS